MTSKISAILFDKDGTLLDFDATFGPATAMVLQDLAGGSRQQLTAMAEAVGFDTVTCAFAPGSMLVSESLAVIADRLFPHAAENSTEALNRRIDELYEKHSLDTLTAFSCLDATLNHLQDMELPLGVATNDSYRTAKAHLGRLDVLAHFCFIAGYDSGHGEKPDPGMVLAFAEHLKLPPNEILMVGDSRHDCEAARAAGAIAVAVTGANGQNAQLTKFADHVMPDISTLPELVRNLSD